MAKRSYTNPKLPQEMTRGSVGGENPGQRALPQRNHWSPAVAGVGAETVFSGRPPRRHRHATIGRFNGGMESKSRPRKNALKRKITVTQILKEAYRRYVRDAHTR